jgi:proprotein convertase subtilisin/kexin type 5
VLGQKECTCPTSQFYNLAATPVACNACQAHCLTCTDATTCVVCKTGLYFDGTNCICAPGYYPSATPAYKINCLQCHASCKTCNGSASTNCLTCFEGTISSGACTCTAGTVRSESMPGGCTACPTLCSACSNTVTCTACTTPNNMIVVSLGTDSRCRCEGASWLNGANCNACPNNCTACINADTCLSCTRGTLFGNTCWTCPLNQYLDSSNACALCTQAACLVCPGDTCSLCGVNSNLATGNVCNCLSGFNLVGRACIRCPIGCSACNSPTVCTSCLPGFAIQSGTCPCATSTNPANSLCVDCHMSCGTCNRTDYTKCLDCATSDYTFTPATNSCACPAGRFDAGNSCVLCKTGCTACTSLTACTSCTAITNLAVTGGVCLCPAGRFYSTNTCAACTAPCTSCIGSATQCLGCPATMSVLNGKCFCVAGFY